MISKEKSKSKKNKQDGKQKNDRKKEADEGWQVFCDFHEITHTVIKEATVTIYRQDNKRMVRHGNKSEKISVLTWIDLHNILIFYIQVFFNVCVRFQNMFRFFSEAF